MLKSSTIAACVLAVSASVALAQTQPVPTTPRGGAPTPDPVTISQPQTMGGQTSGTASGTAGQGYGMQGQRMQDRGMQDYGTQSQATAPDSTDNPRAVAMTDEYGNQYNSRGERIGRGRPARQQMR
jgi:hypothetical protein